MQSLCAYFNVLTKSRIKGFLMAWGAQISPRKVSVLNILGNKLFVCVCVHNNIWKIKGNYGL